MHTITHPVTLRARERYLLLGTLRLAGALPASVFSNDVNRREGEAWMGVGARGVLGKRGMVMPGFGRHQNTVGTGGAVRGGEKLTDCVQYRVYWTYRALPTAVEMRLGRPTLCRKPSATLRAVVCRS